MNKEQQDQFIKEQCEKNDEEIVKLENALMVIKERYKKEISELEDRLEKVKFLKKVFNK